MSGIESLLERLEADAAVGVEETFPVLTQLQVGVDDGLDGADNLIGPEGRADDVADRRVLVGAAAESDLVKLLAVLIDAEDADMAHMVMAAGIDAAGNLDLQFADIEESGKIGEMLADLLRYRDGSRIGQRAVIQAWAGDDIAGESDIRFRELERIQPAPEFIELVLLHVGKHEVLFVADADFAEAVPIGQIGDGIHLRIRGIARHATRGF